MWRLPRNVGTHAFAHKLGCAGRVHLCRRVLAPGLGNAWDLSRAAAVVTGQEGFATYSCRRGTVVWTLCSWACELHMSPGRRVLVGPGSCPEMAFLGVCCKACLCSRPPPSPTGPGAAGQNKQHSITKNTAKLDRETEELHHDRVTLEVGKVIQQGRQSKGLTQKDLATVSVAGPPLRGYWESACGPGSAHLLT